MGNERAETSESAKGMERAGLVESAEKPERAVLAASAVANERDDDAERADSPERAAAAESADEAERPRYVLGYPRIESPTHHLWDGQQHGWPDHLPHEAWRDLIEGLNAEKAKTVSSDDHPAFKAGYAPNYEATPVTPSEEYVANRRGETTRR